MDDQITAHFYGPEPTTQSVKSLTFPITSGSKSLTVTLEQFQKEMNSYLTDCIEKNPTSQPSSMYSQTAPVQLYFIAETLEII